MYHFLFNQTENQTVKDGVILSDRLIIDISKKIDPALTPVADFSVYLGFTAQDGNNELLKFSNDAKRAYPGLLHKYISNHGTGKDVARNLRDIFRENEMVPAAELLEVGTVTNSTNIYINIQ